MSDHNILNLATFDDIQRSFKVSVQPFIVEGGGTMDLGGMNNVFWIKEITWEFKYIDIGVPRARRLPVKEIEVYVSDILNGVTKPLPPFIEPRPVVAKIPFKVINTNLSNNHRLEVEFHLNGVLVSPRPGCEPLPLKKMKAYIMMDSTSRGKLAMDEAAADQLDETLSKLGLGTLRDSIPGGLGALKELPPPLQMAVLQGMAAKGELPEYVGVGLGLPALGVGASNRNPTLALPDEDPEKEISAFMGDLMAILPEECEDVLKRSHLKEIAESMVGKGWRRISAT
jgi:hypothetical protein